LLKFWTVAVLTLLAVCFRRCNPPRLQTCLSISANLDIDDLADFVQSLPDTVTNEVLQGMDKQYRDRLESVLSYPEDSAGGLMDLDAITVRADVTLDVVLRFLRTKGNIPRHTDRIIIIDRFGYYQGVLPVRVLLTRDPETLVADVIRTDVDVIDVAESDINVARLFEDHDLISAPVVDKNNRLLGRITIDDVVDVIREDAEQTVMSMAGLRQEDDFFSPVVRSIRRRWVWLDACHQGTGIGSNWRRQHSLDTNERSHRGTAQRPAMGCRGSHHRLRLVR